VFLENTVDSVQLCQQRGQRVHHRLPKKVGGGVEAGIHEPVVHADDDRPVDAERQPAACS
jgi:hypothetical protein